MRYRIQGICFVLWLTLLLTCSACGGAGAEAGKQGAKLFEQEKYTEALAQFAAAVEADAKNPAYQVQYGMTALQLKQYDAAQSAFAAAIESDKTYRDAYRGMGICLFWQREYEQAANAFETVLQLTESIPEQVDYDSLKWLGETYYQMENPVAAADVYTRLLKLGEVKKEADARINELAVKLFSAEEYEAADALLDAAADLGGEYAQNLAWNRIVLKEQLGAYQKAYELLEDYCAEYPLDTDAVVERAAVELLVKAEEAEAADGE